MMITIHKTEITAMRIYLSKELEVSLIDAPPLLSVEVVLLPELLLPLDIVGSGLV